MLPVFFGTYSPILIRNTHANEHLCYTIFSSPVPPKFITKREWKLCLCEPDARNRVFFLRIGY